ncbi:SRPBCC family protein [Pedobacter sp. MW01-1-1]|uniref:SRPBCC family protein n=1 Tax=Pedobacter sp. MW01-1-1 TaxID=3383027 RepID=UPI003FEFFA4B
MKDEPVVVTHDASPERIWKALTQNDELKQWYFQLEDFKPEVGFKFQFSGGPDDGPQYLHLCEIKEVLENEKITYSWVYEGNEGYSEVSWELSPLGDKTKLTLTHTGIDSFASGGSDFGKSSFNAGWTYFVNEALGGYLEKNDLA